MQSGYGVSEMQQFMAETGSSPFSISAADIHLSPQAPRYPPPHHHHHHYYQQQHYHQHPLLHPHPHHQQQPPSPPPQPQPQRFPHFHPITQQLFQQTHQFQLFQEEQQRRIQQQPHHHHHHLGLDQDSGPENSSSPTRILGGGASGPPFLGGMNFTLAVNGSCDDGTGSKEGLNDEEGILQEGNRPESHVHQWPREEESTIKEPFWRPLDIDSGNKKKGKEKLENYNSREHSRTSKEGSDSASNYKLFSELEAICKLGVNNASSGGANHQAGSGSALTGENPPVIETELGPDCTPNIDVADRRSDTSTDDEEGSLKKKAQKSSGSSSRRKRKRKQQLSSISTFFESLLKQLMDHQEGLHRKFLEALERRDQERMKREEAWRQQEAAKSNRESMARAQEQALAFTREAAIMSFLEKITGESLDLPKKPQFESQFSGESQMEEHKSIEPSDDFNNSNINQGSMNNTSRWPKAEVQALIRVRSSFELRFQEPGLKGPLWEEVSSTMASMGYHRSAKRCKEKWENINKYFRKTKDSVKKRTQFSKSCTYFHQLDQLYSKSLRRTLDSTADISHQPKDNSELLDAIVVSTDPASFNFPEMGSLRSDFNGKNNEDVTGISVARQGFLELGEREDGNAQDNEYGEDEEEEEEGGEGGGGGENEEHELDLSNSKGPRQAEENRHDSTLFFCRRLDS